MYVHGTCMNFARSITDKHFTNFCGNVRFLTSFEYGRYQTLPEGAGTPD